MRLERIAVIDGCRTIFGKAGGCLSRLGAVELGVDVTTYLLRKTSEEVDEVVFGCVGQPADSQNIARVISGRSGIRNSVPAVTVNRNCASGFEAISYGASQILLGKRHCVLTGGTESMSNYPLLYNSESVLLLKKLRKAGSLEKIRLLVSNYKKLLNPTFAIKQGLTDPISGLIMGETAENLARIFSISRQEQDNYALRSHEKASQAVAGKIFFGECYFTEIIEEPSYYGRKDESINLNLNLDNLSNQKPYFDPKDGTVTVGNSCPISDGAGAVVLMAESRAKSLCLPCLGFINGWEYAGCNPAQMGLGPVFAVSKLSKNLNRDLLYETDIIEINEAFAAQVIACTIAFSSKTFAIKHLNRYRALGDIDPNKLNPNGGAIAIGHPVGVSGVRLVITALHELKRRNKQYALVSLCVGGGQGGAMWLERE